jgi:hypothetical protein
VIPLSQVVVKADRCWGHIAAPVITPESRTRHQRIFNLGRDHQTEAEMPLASTAKIIFTNR